MHCADDRLDLGHAHQKPIGRDHFVPHHDYTGDLLGQIGADVPAALSPEDRVLHVDGLPEQRVEQAFQEPQLAIQAVILAVGCAIACHEIPPLCLSPALPCVRRPEVNPLLTAPLGVGCAPSQPLGHTTYHTSPMPAHASWLAHSCQPGSTLISSPICLCPLGFLSGGPLPKAA